MHGKDLCCLKILNFSDVQNVPSRIKQRFANLCNVQINNKMSEFFISIAHLTPEAESEITFLYSPHVIPICQLSLQSKQKV